MGIKHKIAMTFKNPCTISSRRYEGKFPAKLNGE